MKCLVTTAALLAALATPAFAGEPVVPAENRVKSTAVDPATTGSTTVRQSEMAPTATDAGQYGGCQHRSTALNMM